MNDCIVRDDQEADVRISHSTINKSGEFCTLFNNYFNLESCADTEVECKVLEWFSRPACKGTSKSRSYMRGGLETFFDREFSDREIERIYTCLGNGTLLEVDE